MRSPGRSRPRAAIVLACLVCSLVTAGWLGWDLVNARNSLRQAQIEAATLRTQMTSGQIGAARVTADRLRAELVSAQRSTQGPAWGLVGAVPRLGDPLRTLRELTTVLEDLSVGTVPELLTAAARWHDSAALTGDGRLDLGGLHAVSPTLQRGASALQLAADRLSALPERTWVPAIDGARSELMQQLEQTMTRIQTANVATQLLPAMLGAQGERRYLMAFQNSAEARGTGGIAGAFATVRAQDGRILPDPFDPGRILEDASTQVDFGEEYERLYNGAGTTSMYGNANLGPHFPYAAQIWAGMWRDATGERVDGVMALDPAVLSYLLRVVGPVQLSDGRLISADNVVDATLREAYEAYPTLADDPARRAFLGEVQSAVTRAILRPGVDLARLLAALGQAVDERRLLVWSADAGEQRQLERYRVAGVVPRTQAPYVGLSVVNEAGNKLDYYLDRSVIWRRQGCGPQREVTVMIALRNGAPLGLSEYAAQRNDAPPYPVQRGDHRLRVDYLATEGAVLRSATLDRKPWPTVIGSQLGHPHISLDVEVPRGATRTVVLRLTEPDGGGAAPIVLRQPLVRPLHVRLLDDCQ